MAFGQAPSDEEIPAYHPFLQAAAGQVPPQVPQAPAPGGFQPPYYSVAAPQMSVAPPQGAQPQASQPSALPAAAQTAAPAVVLPTAPTAPDSRIPAYTTAMDQRNKDAAPQKVAPKWWERLAGGAVGFGAAYPHGDVGAGIRAGSAVTNRGQIAADEAQAGKLAADDKNIQGIKEQQTMDTSGYENQLRGFNASMETAKTQQGQNNADRTFNRETGNDTFNHSNADRNFNRETGNDTFNHSNSDRQYERQVTEFDAKDKRETARDAESSRHNRADEGIAGAREKREAADAGIKAGKPGKGVNTTVTPEQWQGLLDKRSKDYLAANKEIEEGEGTDQQKQAAKAAKATDLQREWNGRLSTADPGGRYSQGGGTAATQDATPSAPQAVPQAAAPAAPPQAAPPQQAPAPPQAQGGSIQRAPKQDAPLTDMGLARKYLAAANGDKVKARQLASGDGWKF